MIEIMLIFLIFGSWINDGRLITIHLVSELSFFVMAEIASFAIVDMTVNGVYIATSTIYCNLESRCFKWR